MHKMNTGAYSIFRNNVQAVGLLTDYRQLATANK
jgi:hypothetical protein